MFTNEDTWVKSSGDPDFDVTMGSFDGAELCELVGLYILQILGDKFGQANLGLYRDDGLACFHNISGPEADRIRKDSTKIFKNLGLKITIQTNLKIVNFLDVTLDLTTGTYKPYNKPNDHPVYINTKSNHPPSIIKGIPGSISQRISNISASKALFDKAAPYYNKALISSGYVENIKYINEPPQPNRQARKRGRNIIWYNPPFSMNVRTDIGRKFLNLIERHFPNSHRFHKVFNKNNVKLSYSCLPNISSMIQSHNKRTLTQNRSNAITNSCNCRQKDMCPLKGNCMDKNLIYNGNVSARENDVGCDYIGVTENSFKDRLYKHRNSFNYESKANSTELSKHVWNLKRQGVTSPIIHWSVIDHATPYVNGSKKCHLCLTEKFHIITSSLNLLNKRSELVSKCRHENKYYLCNYKTPPDIS